MQEDKRISIIHTPCKDCVFAIYDNNHTQTNCGMGMIDKFINRGYEVLEVYDTTHNFYVINNKKCLFLRTRDWLIKNNIENIDVAQNIALKENSIKYILLLNLTSNSTIENIKKLIQNCLNQKISPVGILAIINNNIELQFDIKILAKYLDQQKIKWRIQKFIDTNLSDSEKIKAIIQSAPMNRYYFYISPENFIDNNYFIDDLNTKILDGLVFGSLAVGGGLFFSYLSWQYAKLNHNVDIISNKTLHIKYEDIK
jgi:hypothetical protein